MYAFLSHRSACDVLRTCGGEARFLPRWPAEPRELPRHRNTVTTQHMFKEFSRDVNLSAYGVTRVPVDLLVPRASQRSRGSLARFHLWKRDVPAAALLRLADGLFVSSPEFVALQLAGWHVKTQQVIDGFVRENVASNDAYAQAGIERFASFDDPFAWSRTDRLVRLVLVACEFMGTYRLPVSQGTATYGQPQLMTAIGVERFLRALPRAYGQNRLREALALSVAHSASPMETALALMLSLPSAYGGYGLPKPELNRSIAVPNHEALWRGGVAITPDLLWPDFRLAIEYDSSEHHADRGVRRLADDATRSNVLTSLGYRVLRVTTLNIQTPDEVARLARQLAGGLGVDVPSEDEALRIRRRKLHALLMGQ